jgi:ABC-2 type transport system permease protein
MTRWIGLALHHLRYINLSYWRNPGAAFFGVFFPLMLLTINSLIFGGGKVTVHGTPGTVATFYVAGMAVFATVMTCFTGLAISVLFDRDQGRLKRIRGTPTPVSAYLCARLLFAILLGLLTSLLCVGESVAFFHVSLTLAELLAFVVTVAVGSASLAALSLAVVSGVSNAQAGPAVLNAVTFPVLFLSSVFYPIDGLPAWLNILAGLLPIRPFAQAATGAVFGAGIQVDKLAIVLAWGVLGAVIAARNFRWQPRR